MDEKLIPAFETGPGSKSGLDFSCAGSREWANTGGDRILVDANYKLIVDNLFDLTHTPFIHRTTFESNDTLGEVPIDVTVSENTVHDLRFMPNIRPTRLYLAYSGCNSDRVDFWLDTHWYAPSNFILEHGITNAGESRENGSCLNNISSLTPETETTTHYFWVNCRWWGTEPHNELLTDLWKQMTAAAFAEDEAALKVQQQSLLDAGFEDLMIHKPVLLESDRSAIQARRVIERMLSDEQSKSD